mgnify:CR=1 FL=1
MSLAVSSVELYQFRNYRHFSLDSLGKVTVFVGENAVGKTNLLEGIHLVCACQSFRHASADQLVYEEGENNQSRVALQLEDQNRSLTLECCIEQGKRQYRMNGKVKPVADIRGIMPSVVFTPDDLFLIKGPHSVRRDALNALGTQLRPSFHTVRHDFDDVLRHKNRLLKDGCSPDYLASINDMMVTCGAQLTFLRASLFDRLAPKIIRRYHELSSGNELLTCEYVPSWVDHGYLEDKASSETQPTLPELNPYTPLNLGRDEARDFMRRSLDNRLADEVMRQRSIIGPHMDKVVIRVDGRDAGDFASQGQQRSIVLAWKLAEVDLIAEVLGIVPVVLLDDVMSELDEKRRGALETCIQEGSQAFITTTNLGYFTENLLETAAIITLPRE